MPLKPDTKAAVEDQVDRFMDGLLHEDVQSEAFKARLDSAFALGREEVSVASGLMQGRLLQRNFAGVEDSSAFKAIQQMRAHLDQLNPGKEGDLFQPQKLLGLIPYGNKLQAYFRKYQGASGQLQTSMQQLYAARDDMQRDVVDLEATRAKLWEAMQKLAAAIHFAATLDERLHDKVEALKSTDAARAKALEQEVLFYARQNLQDMLTQQAVCTNGYLALDVLKKTGREMMNGCSRIATTGMSALAVAQTVARATGNQIATMEMLQGVNASIEGLIAETGRQLNTHVERTTQFAQNPMIGIEKLQEMFDQTFKAMDAMDDFRTKAIEVMGQNNTIIKEQIAKADQYVDRTRQRQAREAATAALAGPVAL
ncbi:toxic anion resistance protein [Caenimonas sp. DR4.4]|uniref:Toxic anion resistance protein n=2 Tax=Caenimonas aquaedulcis TaxID=2793270 RepID=A0A931H527_9BURK|nr:toxic anion resistance protein [Caenimonas aquaedulcis]MBG9388791.1 toxic anion resistance protein [Caenimonas aquaedulcis]